jgi:hypothetical protein
MTSGVCVTNDWGWFIDLDDQDVVKHKTHFKDRLFYKNKNKNNNQNIMPTICEEIDTNSYIFICDKKYDEKSTIVTLKQAYYNSLYMAYNIIYNMFDNCLLKFKT